MSIFNFVLVFVFLIYFLFLINKTDLQLNMYITFY